MHVHVCAGHTFNLLLVGAECEVDVWDVSTCSVVGGMGQGMWGMGYTRPNDICNV